MEILDTLEDDHDEQRPPPKRKPLHPRSIWQGLVGNTSPLVIIPIAAWIYASLHVWWALMDALHSPLFEDESLSGAMELAGVAQGDEWDHPFRRVSGEVSAWWEVGLIAWLCLGIAVVAVTLNRHGDVPARRWFIVFVTIAAAAAYCIYLPERVYLFSWLLIPVVVIAGLTKATTFLFGRGEKIEGIMQAWGAAAVAQLIYLPITGFIIAYGPGTILVQLPLFIPWLFGLGGAGLAILVWTKVGLIAFAAFVVPLVARTMTKF